MSVPAITQIDLLLLGMLQDRPMHGYELHQQIRNVEIDTWFNVSMAGVYYSLGKLHERGLVHESRQRRGGGAAKAIYHLTDAGRNAFFEALETQVASQNEVHFDYHLGIFFLNRLPLARARGLLQRRRSFLSEWEELVLRRLERARAQDAPATQVAIMDHVRRFIQMERIWLDDVIGSIQDASEGDPDSPPAGLMLMTGDLHQYHLPDLIHLIASGQHSGTLTITDGALVRSIGFTEGRPRCIAAYRRGDPAATPMTADDMIDAIYDLFRWQEGSFTFEQAINQHGPCVPFEASAERLILRGCRWVDSWEIIQRLVPSSEAVFERVSTGIPLDDQELQPLELDIARAMDGSQDIATIARNLGLTIFEASRCVYCLAAIGLVRTADQDRIRVRRAFREIAELMCNSTLAWRRTPDDRTCEQEVNQRCQEMPLRIIEGRIWDQTDPNLKTEDLADLYQRFLRIQMEIISQFFGLERAKHSYERTIRQLVPELQEVARRWGFARGYEESV